MRINGGTIEHDDQIECDLKTYSVVGGGSYPVLRIGSARFTTEGVDEESFQPLRRLRDAIDACLREWDALTTKDGSCEHCPADGGGCSVCSPLGIVGADDLTAASLRAVERSLGGA